MNNKVLVEKLIALYQMGFNNVYIDNNMVQEQIKELVKMYKEAEK